MNEPCALLIIGTVGAGKTTTAAAVVELLRDRQVPNALIDLDELSRAWPPPADDRFNSRLALRNLQAVAKNYVEGGARVLVVAGVIESETERLRFADAVAVPLTVVRLRLALQTVRTRLLARHGDDPAALEWHVQRLGVLHDVLERNAAEDVVVDVSDSAQITEVAEAVLSAAGW